MNTEPKIVTIWTALLRMVEDGQRTEFNVNTLKFDHLLWEFFNVVLKVDIILKVSEDMNA